jgi:hypothetical protein
VAEDLLEDLHRLVGLHPERGERVPEGVQPSFFRQAGLLSERLEVAAKEIVAVHRELELLTVIPDSCLHTHRGAQVEHLYARAVEFYDATDI